MRVVVSGAAGFIGSHLVEALLAQGCEVVGIDAFTDFYPRADKEANLVEAAAQPGFSLVEADLRTADLEPLVEGADAVVNLAATPGLRLGWDDFTAYQSSNVNGAKRLADACLAVGVGHFIQASTSSVYGAEAMGDEHSPKVPVSPYGVTKLTAEKLLQALGQTMGLPLTTLRYFSIYGPRQRPDMAYRIFCEQLLRGETLTVYGDGHQSRSNTYVGDCVAATVAALRAGPSGEIYNVGGGRELALLDAISILAAALEVEPRIDFQAARRGDQRRTVADTGHIRSALGWEPVVTPEEGLAAEVAWVRARQTER